MTPASRPRKYFSIRNGKTPEALKLDLSTLKALFLNAYDHFGGNGYFDEAFGSYCVDAGEIEGTVGANVEAYVLFTTMKKDVWPIGEKIGSYSENDLFDMIEFLFDHISKPQQKDYHSWDGCGYHYSDFSTTLGQEEYRERLNLLLERYGSGYELNARGELMELSPHGLRHLLTAQLPTKDLTVTEKVQSAIDRFRRYGSSLDERQKSVRDLADVLEWLRPQIKTALLKKDEQELFQLANNFGIRHLNQNQKIDYDRAVWLSWMFYHYLATINACLHLMERQGRAAGSRPPRRS
jgi:hypothetical protein